MPNIVEGTTLWTVIVTVDALAETMAVLVEHARWGLRRFPDYPGFVGGALHESDDGTRLVQYLQWSSEAEYLACRDDPTWNEAPTTKAFMAAVDAGQASVDERAFSVIATS